ncbi:sensor histidine kinase [Vacuolonema iberomarrocanum]|uniref:sensor histidine kinase n=1 Tax=Vacuolonema iberomarrocanum TaxID=3454632 RepID=UPI0019F1B1A4|nr:GAF domain-containing protein [filamentous cyanobacterium LEGE 07170]
MPEAAESSSFLSLLFVGTSSWLVEPVVEALRRGSIAFVYEFAIPPISTEVQERGQSYDVVLVLDAPDTTDASEDISVGIAHALSIAQWPKHPIPVIWIVSEANETAAIAALDTGVSDCVQQRHLSSLPMVLLRTLRDCAARRTNRALTRRLQQQQQQERLIHTIAQTRRQTLDYEAVMQIVVDELHQAFDLDRCLMFAVEPNGDRRFRFASHATPDRDRVLQQEAICTTRATYLSQIRRGEPVIFQAQNDGATDLFQERMRAWQVKTCLILPLVCHGTYFGGLVLQTCQAERQWEVEELDGLRRVSDQCAIALHHGKLFEQTQRQAQAEALLNRIGRTLNASLDLPSALQEILPLVGQQLGGDRVVLYRAHPDSICIQSEWCRTAEVPSLQGTPITPPSWVRELVGVDSSDLPTSPLPPSTSLLLVAAGLPERIEEANTAGMVAVPIFVRSVFYGGLELHRVPGVRDADVPQKQSLTKAETALLQRIADQLAIALYNAESHENLELVIHERTQQLEAEKRISEAANLAKSEFLAHISHELRTPLTGIIGFSNVLSSQMHSLLTPQQTQYLEGITACGQHLLDMINDLLDLSKVEAGKEELFLEPVVIQEICDVCLNMFQEAAHSKALQLDLVIEPDLSFCVADKRRIKQILSNLLSNAVKFTKAGFVQLQVSERNNMLRFVVEDSGIGIPEADQAQLFDPFHQGQNQTFSSQGTGLGLTLARKLARLHGGDITFTSTLGRGSCFTLWLPHFDHFPELANYVARPSTVDTFPILSCNLEPHQARSS